ncbi:hypothetical protein I6A60_07390, partial [Frankia sp. AgB1.9]|uniref:NB-ARC domain-containing protein n=1 Tax=unclassified Frankia TaxID=2632575 RepID=UPI00193204C9
MGDGLSEQEIIEFARIYWDPAAARNFLETAGLGREHHPGWNAGSAMLFWAEVSRLIENGAVPGGRRRLYAAALKQFPDNPTFATETRAVSTRTRVPSSWDEARAAWPLPDPFVDRAAVLETARDLLTVTGAGPVGVIGMGGAGKSTTARAILHDDTVRDRFSDGPVWIEVNPDANVAAIQTRVLAAFGDPRPVLDVAEGYDRLRGMLAGARCLIVLDDVWEPDVADGFPRLTGVRLLVTSRGSAVLRAGAPICPVGLVDEPTARQLLAAYARQPVPDVEPARRIVDRCGGLAVALAIAGGLIGELWEWDDVADAFDQADLAELELTRRLPDYPHPNLLRVIDAGLRLLPNGAADRLAELAVFKGRGPIPVPVVLDLWAATGPLDPRAARGLLRQLAGASLIRLNPDTRTIGAHDLVFDYTRGSLPPGRYEILHRLVAHRFLDRWGGLDKGLPLLNPVDRRDASDRYGLAQLVSHLFAADDPDTVDAIFTAERHTPDGRTESVWYTAHEDQGTTTEYLTAIHAARDHALTHYPSCSPVGLARQANYALILGSITSLAANIPLPLLLRLVETGRWLPGRALTYAQAIPGASTRAQALTALAPVVPTEQRAAVLNEALAAASAVDEPYRRALVMRDLAEYVPVEQRAAVFGSALAAVGAIDEPAARGSVLGALVSRLPAELLGSALAAASAIDEPAARAAALHGLVPRLPAELIGYALAAVGAIGEPAARGSVLGALVSRLPAELLGSALAAA